MDKLYYLWGLVILLLAIGMLACEGPAGPEGPQGLQGEQGLQGDQGPEGTANVIYSDWTAFDVSNWSDAYSVFGQMRRDYPIDEPFVDEDILARGTVAVYARIPGQPSIADVVFHLPWIYNLTKGIAQHLAFELSPSIINIYFHDLVDQSVDPGSFGSQVEYRYIILPGGTQAKAIGLDLTDYYAVMKHFGIQP